MRPSLSPARIASRGLKLAGKCSSACTMKARLIVSAATARRLGLGSRSVAIGSGRTSAVARRATALTVRLTRAARTKLSRTRSANVTLEITVSGAGTASRRATRRLSLG